MDDDEVFFLILFAIIALVAAFAWVRPLIHRPRGTGAIAATLFVLPIICISICIVVLMNWADPQVRQNAGYQGLFLAGLIVWLAATGLFLRCIGLSAIDDGVDRRNSAAVVAIAGAMLGVTFTYVGANIGQGPTIFTTLGPAMLGAAVLFACWLLHASFARPDEQIGIERDLAAAVRLAGLHVATGAIIGCAMAGDWIDTANVFHDLLHVGWPAAALVIAAAVIDRALRPTIIHPRRALATTGLPWAAAYLLVTAIVVFRSTG